MTEINDSQLTTLALELLHMFVNSSSVSLSYFSPRLENKIIAKLDPNETIRWVGKPDPSVIRREIWLWALCSMAFVIGCVLSVLIYQHIDRIVLWPMFKDFPPIVVKLFLGVNCYNMLAAWLWPFVLSWFDKRTAYVITNQRVILLADFLVIIHVMAVQIDQIQKLKRAPGSKGYECIKIFAAFEHPFMPGVTWKPSFFVPTIKLRHLTDGRAVEAMLRQA